jgi:hypothetical protein
MVFIVASPTEAAGLTAPLLSFTAAMELGGPMNYCCAVEHRDRETAARGLLVPSQVHSLGSNLRCSELLVLALGPTEADPESC